MVAVSREVANFASGIALLYMGPNNGGDEYTDRLLVAMETGDLDEVEHITSLLMLRLMVAGTYPAFASGEWYRLFHTPSAPPATGPAAALRRRDGAG